eukprot:m.314903 g.314903  ORF g.314903 m.314903 type:complete len:53 (+) comp27511_c1_seq4:25-183(+)
MTLFPARINSWSGSQPANPLIGDTTGVEFGVCRNTEINKREADNRHLVNLLW